MQPERLEALEAKVDDGLAREASARLADVRDLKVLIGDETLVNDVQALLGTGRKLRHAIIAENLNDGVAGTDFDQINVNGDVILGGTLEISLLTDNNYIPSEGDTFDILTFTGSLSGSFDNATGLFGFGDGNLYFEINILLDSKIIGEVSSNLDARI